MKTILNVAESLAKLNNWKIERLDLRLNKLNGIEFYSAYLDVEDSGKSKRILIREKGSFEFVEEIDV